jgi:hypothetical protein
MAMTSIQALLPVICFAAGMALIQREWAGGRLAIMVCMVCTFGSLAVILLVLRDSRGRFNLQTLFLVMAFAALFLWAAMLTIKTIGTVA